MKFGKQILFAQEGAAMPTPEEQNAPAQEAAPAQANGAEAQLQQIAGQLVEMLMQQIGDPQAVMAVLQMATEIVGQAAQPAAPAYQRQGGRLVRVQH